MMAHVDAIIPSTNINSRSVRGCHKCSAASLSRSAVQPLLEQQCFAQPGTEHKARFAAAAAALQALELSLLCEDDSDFVQKGQESLATACLCFSKASVAAVLPGSHVSRVGSRQEKRENACNLKVADDDIKGDTRTTIPQFSLAEEQLQLVSVLVGQLLQAMEASIQQKSESNTTGPFRQVRTEEAEDTVSLPFSTCNSLVALLSPLHSSTSSLPPLVAAQEPELSCQASHQFSSNQAKQGYGTPNPYGAFFVEGVTTAGIQVEALNSPTSEKGMNSLTSDETLNSPTSEKESQTDDSPFLPRDDTYFGNEEQFRFTSVLSRMDGSSQGAYFQQSNAVHFGSNAGPPFSNSSTTQDGVAVSEREVLGMLREMHSEDMSGVSIPSRLIFDEEGQSFSLEGLSLGDPPMLFRRASCVKTLLNISPLELRQQFHIHLRM